MHGCFCVCFGILDHSETWWLVTLTLALLIIFCYDRGVLEIIAEGLLARPLTGTKLSVVIVCWVRHAHLKAAVVVIRLDKT